MLLGLIEYEQLAPSWFTVNVLPATEIVPLRDEVPVFAATE